MKFLLDESAELRLAAYLREQGHDVTAIAVDYQASLADEDVLVIAVSENRILLTNDTDFGELIFRENHDHSGVVLFRFADLPVPEKIDSLRQLLATRAIDPGDFVVLAPGSVRIRPRR